MELPAQVQPARLARQERRLHGAVPIAELPRLSAELVDNRGSFLAELEFSRDQKGRDVLRISLEGVVRVVCQRCLETMPLELALASTVLLAAAADEVQEEANMETHVMDGELLDVRGLIEDELLLALPFAPAHPPERCTVGVRSAPSGSYRPFAELRRLKR